MQMPEKTSLTSELFAVLTDIEKAELTKIGRKIEFFERKCLFQHGDLGSSFYIISKGEVTISIMSDEGREIILNRLSDGDAFGEIAMFDQGQRTADAYVTAGSSLIAIEREDFLKVAAKLPGIYSASIHLLCNRLRWCSDLLEDFLFHDIMEQVIIRLVSLAEKHVQQSNALIEISQDELAKMSNASREAVNRSLQLLQDKGLLFLQRKRIIIPDVKQLKKLQKGK